MVLGNFLTKLLSLVIEFLSSLRRTMADLPISTYHVIKTLYLRVCHLEHFNYLDESRVFLNLFNSRTPTCLFKCEYHLVKM